MQHQQQRKPVPILDPIQKQLLNEKNAQKITTQSNTTSTKSIESSGKKNDITDNLDDFAKYLETLDIDELKKTHSSLEKQLADLKTNPKGSSQLNPDSLLNRSINHVKWYIERWIINHPPQKPQKTNVSKSRDTTNKVITVQEVEKLFSKVHQQTSKTQTTKRYQPVSFYSSCTQIAVQKFSCGIV